MLDKKKEKLGFCALCAFSIWLGFPNDFISIPPLALFWPASLFYLGPAAKNWKEALRLGWLAAFAGSFAVLYWLCLPVKQVGGLPWPAALACAGLITIILSFQSGLFAAFSNIIAKAPFWRRLLLCALAWYLLETLFAVVAGFPWLPVAGALIQWPLLAQGADLIGASFLASIWFASILLCLRPMLKERIAGALCIIALLGYGSWRLASNPLDRNPQGPDTMAAIMIEGNVDQNTKWEPKFQKQSLDLYLRLSQEALKVSGVGHEGGVEDKPLLIWPETAMPFFYERNPALARQMDEAVAQMGCPLLFGAPGVEKSANGDEIFNRAFLLGPGGNIIGYYDKEHLVPFGEYAPEWLKLDFLEALLQGVGVYSEGQSSRPLVYGKLALGILICYEGIFPWLAQERVEAGANLLIDISNDGWFGKTPAARQHLYLTALRCIEQGRWLLRATNTGISAAADASGRVVTRGPMYKAGFLPCRAKLLEAHTIYYYVAAWLPWLAMGVFCIIFLFPMKTQGVSHVSFE